MVLETLFQQGFDLAELKMDNPGTPKPDPAKVQNGSILDFREV